MDDAPRERARGGREGEGMHRIASRRAAPSRIYAAVGGLNGDASAKFVGYLKRNFCLYYARQIADGRAVN